MSAGGVFKLIANDGKADRMIMATELINQRIKDIMCARSQQGFPDPTPTLVDLERTHILFVNAHFKPFAAIGYEYNKVTPQSGSGGSKLSAQTVQFSIPQFGDFFNDMVLHVILDKVKATNWAAGDIPAFPAYIGASDQALTATSSFSATNDAINLVYTTYLYQYVTQDGTVVNRATATGANFVRYCEYPGERLLKKVQFQVNGNPLDDYTSDVTIFNRKFRLAPGKVTGWKRLVGQEVEVEAYTDLVTIDTASVWPSQFNNLMNQAVPSVLAPVCPVSATQNSRLRQYVLNGPQTPRAEQPALELWIPLLFWFNKD